MYETHFRPDVSDANLAHILRALGTDVDGEIESTYDFADLRAGDDIDVCHVTTGGEEPKTCFTTQIDSATHTVTADTPDTTVHIVAQVDSAWTGGAGHAGPVDDPGMAVNVSQIFLRTNGNITATEIEGDMLVGHIHSTNGDVILHSPRRILDADGRPTIDVTGVNITMYAGEGGVLGGIGVPSNWLEINTAVNQPTGIGGGVLKAYDTAAAIGGGSTEGIFLDELTGDMPIWEIFTGGSSSLATGNVGLRTTGGSILNAKLDPDEDNVRGDAVDIDANGGSIGLTSKDVMVDSGRAPPFGCTWLNCGDDPNSPWKSDPALAAAGDDVGLEATAGIYYTETDAYLRLVLAHSLTGDIRLTVRESVQLDEDLYLVASGTARFAESNTRGPQNDGDAPRGIPHGTIFAEQGSVELRVGDDITLHQNSQILADLSIDIRGDFGNLDTGGGAAEWGTSMILRGRIVADCVVSDAGAGDDPLSTCTPSGVNPVPGRQTNVWGGSDVDVIVLGDRSGLDRAQTSDPALNKEQWGDDGYIFLGAKTTVHGNSSGASNTADGEDILTVYYLQSMNVVTSPATGGTGAGHVLTLDGQGESDHYAVHTNGSHGNVRNYNIQVLDSGPANQGVDELAVYGFDDLDPAHNTGLRADDIWLLRALTCIDNESPFSVTAVGGAAVCSAPSDPADHPAYIALLAGNESTDGGIGLYRDRTQGNEPSSKVQRITYDRALNGRITVYGLGGNDAFYVDDTQATMTLDGGAGNDAFQIGQIFGTQRDSDPAPDGGALLPADTFPSLVPTTRGWLSPGAHAPLLATGGTGNDRFVVYSNQAEIQLNGDDDNDLFIVRAFAIAAVCDTDATGDGLLHARGRHAHGGARHRPLPGRLQQRRRLQRRRRRRLHRVPQGQQRRRHLQQRRRAHDLHAHPGQPEHRPRQHEVARRRHPARRERRRRAGDRPRVLDQPAARHPCRRRRGRGAVQRQRSGQRRRRHRVRQARHPRHRVRRRLRDHRQGDLRRRPQREVRHHRGARDRRPRGRRPVLRPLHGLRRGLPGHRRAGQRPDLGRGRRDRRHRDPRARGPLRRRRPHRALRRPALRRHRRRRRAVQPRDGEHRRRGHQGARHLDQRARGDDVRPDHADRVLHGRTQPCPAARGLRDRLGRGIPR